MHDIEHKPEHDGKSDEISETSRDSTIQKSTNGNRPPHLWRYIIVSGAVVLTFIVIVASFATFNRPVGQQTSLQRSLSPTATNLTATPATSLEPLTHDVLVTMADGILYAGTGDKAMYALRADDGKLLWHGKLDAPVSDPPLVENGIVYINAFQPKVGPSYLYAVRASDGIVLWRHKSDNYLFTGMDNGVLYVVEQDIGIFALRSSDGKLLWRNTTPFIDDAPLISNGIIYVHFNTAGGGSGTLSALRASDGKQIWHYNANGFINGLATMNGVVYAGSSEGIYTALNTNNGHILWQRQLEGTMYQQPQVVNGVLYLATTKMTEPAATTAPRLPPFASLATNLLGAHTWTLPVNPAKPAKMGRASVYALRVSDGTVLWRYAINKGQGNSWSSWLTVENGVVYGSATGENTNARMFALHGNDGSVIWDHTSNVMPSATLSANGMIYVAGSTENSCTLSALSANNGSLLWSHRILDGPVYCDTILLGSSIYVSMDNGTVYALRTNDGSVLWHYEMPG